MRHARMTPSVYRVARVQRLAKVAPYAAHGVNHTVIARYPLTR